MLTLQFVAYDEIAELSSKRRINKLLTIVKKNSVVLLQGQLKPTEETALIQKTMEDISRTFKGIELCTVLPESKNKQNWVENAKTMLVRKLIGNRDGFTIIGPATVVKEIKKNPQKVELLIKKARGRK
ncbi:DUF2073 domain-containing protein [archaeon]|jgi:hypothetical protein|nr:DUF2073 domain-containing protein [archaeon]MBT4416628.1 DUF2073 domain-containing protein [archaeon]